MPRNVILVAGLLYGDESKGASCSWLTKDNDASLIVRYNGGCQTAHNVIEDGIHHTFSQFGSGLLNNHNLVTLLSKHMIVNPRSLAEEAWHLETKCGVENPMDKVIIEESALITTPFHAYLNRAREESRGSNKHGSCGQGVGETRSMHINCKGDTLFAVDLLNKGMLREKLEFIQAESQRLYEEMLDERGLDKEKILYWMMSSKDIKIDALVDTYDEIPLIIAPDNYLETVIEDHDFIIFEGAQGVLLDEDLDKTHGTWTDTTFGNAEDLLIDAGYKGNIDDIGCIRTYATRHGKGNFTSDKYPVSYRENYNKDSSYQGKFRMGALSEEDLKLAIDYIGGVSSIHLSHCDIMCKGPMHIIRSTGKIETFDTDQSTKETHKFFAAIAEITEARITVTGYGPSSKDRERYEVPKDKSKAVVQVAAG